MLLIKSVNTYTPSSVGITDILALDRQICNVSPKIELGNINFTELEVIDGAGLTAVPGFVDNHIHITGGGGEGGFQTRAPEIMFSTLTLDGITTCGGLLGTDATTRSIANVFAKAKSLESEGISTFIWTGSYQFPLKTLTGSARDDIVFIDKVIGIGEVALSDHRANRCSEAELSNLATEARVGGLISGKCGVLLLHLGDGKEGLEPLMRLTENSNMPKANFLPTHVNRKKSLFNEAVQYAAQGGFIDITTSIISNGEDNIVDPAEALSILLSNNVSEEHITMSSDAGGSSPSFDSSGKLKKMDTASPSYNLDALRACVKKGIPLEKAIVPFTYAPAKLLKLTDKGEIKKGKDADILLLDQEMKIHTVIAKGKVVVLNYKPVVLGVFEKQ